MRRTTSQASFEILLRLQQLPYTRARRTSILFYHGRYSRNVLLKISMADVELEVVDRGLNTPYALYSRGIIAEIARKDGYRR